MVSPPSPFNETADTTGADRTPTKRRESAPPHRGRVTTRARGFVPWRAGRPGRRAIPGRTNATRTRVPSRAATPRAAASPAAGLPRLRFLPPLPRLLGRKSGPFEGSALTPASSARLAFVLLLQLTRGHEAVLAGFVVALVAATAVVAFAALVVDRARE